MSVVVVVNSADAIYVGADTAVTYNNSQQVLVDDAKIYRVGDIIAGGAGSADHVTLFRAFLEDVQKENVIGHALSDMVSLWSTFKAYVEAVGIDLYDNDLVMSQFVVVVNKHPWLIEGFHVREIVSYEAIGGGDAEARSALYLGHTIEEALDVACHFEIGCSYPLLVYTIPKNSDDVRLTKYERSGIVSARQLPPSSNGQDATVLTL